MAEPAYVSAGAYLDGSAADAAVAVPGSTAAGRLVIVAMFMDGEPLAVNPAMPTGFSAAPSAPVQIPAISGNHTLYLWWKRLTGADSGSYTFTWSGSRYREAQALLYQNVIASGNPWDGTPGAAFSTTESTTTPAVSTTSLGADRKLIFAATNWSGGTWTVPTGHTRRMSGGAQIICVSERSWPTAAATGSVTATVSNSDKGTAWLGALIGTTAAAPASFSGWGVPV